MLAEIGVNHDGEVGVGEELVRAAKGAGVDGVKFQLFEAEKLLAREAGLVGYQKDSAGSAGELLSGLELSVGEMKGLVEMAKGLGMAAVVTPFSVELVGACVEMGVDAIKLASPDLVNLPLVREVVGTGLPMILSTGGAEMREVEEGVEWLVEGGALERAVVLQCVSSYPTPAEEACLGGIVALRNRFGNLRVGYSDHTVETFTAAMAVAAGACFLEKHLTLDRGRKGPDHGASLEPEGMGEYVRMARGAYRMRGGMVKAPLEREMEVREQTRQSVAVVGEVKAGTVLTREMLTVKRPGTGVAAKRMEWVVGRKVVRDLGGNTVLREGDLEGEGSGV
ncbi:MAG: N-acetylneuraminate synthase family protein [Phycisphaerae bacterium]